MAEERGEHCWSYRRELHDAVNDDVRQRFDLRCGRQQYGGEGGERGGDAGGGFRPPGNPHQQSPRESKKGGKGGGKRSRVGRVGRARLLSLDAENGTNMSRHTPPP